MRPSFGFVEKWLVLVALEASTDGDYKVTHDGNAIQVYDAIKNSEFDI